METWNATRLTFNKMTHFYGLKFFAYKTLFCKVLFLDEMGAESGGLALQGWCSQGWFCLTGFIKHIQNVHRALQNLHRAFLLDTKKRNFFPQVLYLDLLCGRRVWVVSSRKVETAELGAGESGARQDHCKCFRGLRTHLQPRLPWHEKAFSAWEKPTRLLGR